MTPQEIHTQEGKKPAFGIAFSLEVASNLSVDC